MSTPSRTPSQQEGDEVISLILYAASLAMRAWRDVVEANQRAKGAVGEEQQDAGKKEVADAWTMFQLSMAALERAFLIPPPGYRPPGG